MKFLIDAQLPPALGLWIRARGHEARVLRDIGLRDASDRNIWDYASRENLTIVTKDEDFAQLAVLQEGPTVLWVRTGNLVNRLLLARFEKSWIEIEAHLASGAKLVELR